MKTVAELKEELSKIDDDYYCHPNTLKGYVYLSEDKSLLKKPKVDSFTTDPFSARVMILKLEEDYNLNITVYDTEHYCKICITKERKDV